MGDKEDNEKFAEIVTEPEREFAQNALSEFLKSNYSGCLQCINKIESRLVYDFKVAHNKMAVEYYKSDLKKLEPFQKNLNLLFSQFRIKLDKLDDVNHCVAHYNQALLFYHQRQYTKALRIIERVYKFIEPMDEILARQVGLLLIELQLCIRQPEKALGLITYLENHLINTSINKIGGKNIKDSDKDLKIKRNSVHLDSVTEAFKFKLIRCKIRCFFMNHSLASAKEEFQLLAAQDKTNTTGLIATANLEYLQGNYQESMQILDSISDDALNFEETGESSSVLLNNNRGVIYHAMGKPHLACHHYQKAIKEDQTLNAKIKIGESHLHMLGVSKQHELLYNLGVSLLHAGRSTDAFDCFTVAVRRYHRNSRLYLRLAECCIQLHKPNNEVDCDIQTKQKEMVVTYIGTKEKQKIVLTTSLSKDRKYSVEGQSSAMPLPTLEFASLCLRNAYLHLPLATASSPEPMLLIPGVTPPAPLSPGPAPSSPLSTDGIAALKNAILAASAYIAICLGDYILALEHAQNLLVQPKLSGAHKLLAHLYSAEAFILMDQISDALDYLNPESIKDLSLELPADDNGIDDEQFIKTSPPTKWFPSVLSSAHAVLQYNIAVCKTLRGQLDQAGHLLKQIWQNKGPNSKVPAQILMLVLYIELRLGHADVARSLIKQYSFQHRING